MSYAFTEVVSGSTPNYINVNGLMISIVDTRDWSLKQASPITIRIETKLSNGSLVAPHTFTITFNYDCNYLTPDVSSSTWVALSITHDIVTDAQKDITLPTVTIGPSDCSFTTTWYLLRVSDDKSMLSKYSTLFTFTQTQF